MVKNIWFKLWIKETIKTALKSKSFYTSSQSTFLSFSDTLFIAGIKALMIDRQL